MQRVAAAASIDAALCQQRVHWPSSTTRATTLHKTALSDQQLQKLDAHLTGTPGIRPSAVGNVTEKVYGDTCGPDGHMMHISHTSRISSQLNGTQF
jgi:hypothetical protein